MGLALGWGCIYILNCSLGRFFLGKPGIFSAQTICEPVVLKEIKKNEHQASVISFSGRLENVSALTTIINCDSKEFQTAMSSSKRYLDIRGSNSADG